MTEKPEAHIRQPQFVSPSGKFKVWGFGEPMRVWSAKVIAGQKLKHNSQLSITDFSGQTCQVNISEVQY